MPHVARGASGAERVFYAAQIDNRCNTARCHITCAGGIAPSELSGLRVANGKVRFVQSVRKCGKIALCTLSTLQMSHCSYTLPCTILICFSKLATCLEPIPKAAQSLRTKPVLKALKKTLFCLSTCEYSRVSKCVRNGAD